MMIEEAGNPPLLMMDVWPFQHPTVLIRSHDIAEQLTKPSKLFPHSVPKSPHIALVTELLGKDSMILKEVRSISKLADGVLLAVSIFTELSAAPNIEPSTDQCLFRVMTQST